MPAPISPDQQREIVCRFIDGQKICDIARCMEISTYTVGKVLKITGLKQPGLTSQPVNVPTLEEIAERAAAIQALRVDWRAVARPEYHPCCPAKTEYTVPSHRRTASDELNRGLRQHKPR